jgi:hypothetical protein
MKGFEKFFADFGVEGSEHDAPAKAVSAGIIRRVESGRNHAASQVAIRIHAGVLARSIRSGSERMSAPAPHPNAG